MKKILSLVLAIFISGCTTHLTDLSVVSNKNINLETINIDKLPQKKGVVGRDEKFVFLIIPLGHPTIKEAVNDALKKGDGDLMIDTSVYVTNWWFLIGQTGIEVKGTVVNTKGEQK